MITLDSSLALPHPYGVGSVAGDGADCGDYVYCHGGVDLPVSSSTASKDIDAFPNDFTRDNEKHDNRQALKKYFPINRGMYDPFQYSSTHLANEADETSHSPKKCSILSKFYKADGSPIKSLWDNEMSLKEQRTYKYDPKPLERRKNPRSFVPDDRKTDEYWQRRKKNNQAARKSREDRRRKEIEILKNVENLKSDNFKLKIYAQKIVAENQGLKYEAEMLKSL